MQPDIKIIPFTGKNIKSYLPSIARLRVEVFREFPFLQEKKLEDELKHLKKYAQSPEAFVVIVFDGPIIVGASTGIPLYRESEILHKPLLEKNLDISSFFFFSESLLLKPYRGRGIGHHFFELREAHARELGKYKHICFCAIQRPHDDTRIPKEYMHLNDFWRKRGFQENANLHCKLSWKDVGEKHPTEKNAVFWTKKLSTEP